MNHATLIGRFTRDPELKYSQTGKAYCKFSLAVQKEFNRDEADFINCVAFDKRAETICEYLRKGRRIALQGRISTRNYDHEGETRWVTEVIVDKFDFIDSASGNPERDEYEKEKNDFDKKIDNAGEDDSSIDDFPF